jgi:hypothetical protein
MFASAVGSGEQRVFSSESDRTHGTLDSVGIQLQAAVIEEQDQSAPVIERIADGLGQSGSAGDAVQGFCQPGMHRLDQGAAAFPTDAAALVGGLAADIGFDRIKLGDPPQGLLGKR